MQKYHRAARAFKALLSHHIIPPSGQQLNAIKVMIAVLIGIETLDANSDHKIGSKTSTLKQG